jgi:hypothetical protein
MKVNGKQSPEEADPRERFVVSYLVSCMQVK